MNSGVMVSAGQRPRFATVRNRRGVTLVELVLLLVVASIALPGLMVYFTEAMEHSADAQLWTLSASLAQELMEEIKAKRWDQQTPIPPGVPTAVNALGPETGETRCDPALGCQAYNDVDDYNGLNISPPRDSQGKNTFPSTYAAAREQVDVCYVNPVLPTDQGGGNSNAGVCSSTGPTDYKMITVTVCWNAPSNCKTDPDVKYKVQLQTIVANYALTSS